MIIQFFILLLFSIGIVECIKFRSRVDIYLPISSKIEVKIGQKVRGGETVIAKFIEL